MFTFLKKIFGSKEGNDLATYLKSGAVLVDVRTIGEYKSGTAKGAINIPVDQLSNKLSKLNKESKIIVFCRSGMRSGQAKRVLNQNGYQQVVNGGSVGNVIKHQK
ncbi:rhodanese-like domain-containing protein [Myroides pelagicus]|uniref:Rhodanese-like domain-containing protein n=1 Tax=Myroides pelagicus TaxID=270914 RepID=A0A7K1GPC7_9FLAO|nr:rhodanese-like domain-containing protein [Myroides pelagicus]MEC4113544.1 rhodanese-like domain-containing protein [Myroides pelagicus]MTH30064.1 rhodanese-like domain-containing protein [Myroides pelagicus]